MIKGGKLELDFEDEVISGACITEGEKSSMPAAKEAASTPGRF